MTEKHKTIRAILVTALLLKFAATAFTGRDKTVFYSAPYTAPEFDYAYIELPDGEIVEGRVNYMKTIIREGMVQVVIDGTTYLTHANRVVLVHTKGDKS